ncbi:MAG TPA: type III-B CRISPR module RAMP protein Cmr1 [Syntrophomonadaceae bacterium]|nr:type III-B CRISPR module RAMP protein Cmr1 [Syntrophomonadaceae bacterium]
MLKLEATYKITTPLFLGGADAEEIAEIRPPSLKGLLRFWFRALALPQLGSLDAVWAMERELFGSTKNQASFMMSVTDINIQKAQNSLKGHGIGYLGYGVIDTKGNTLRPYLKPGGRFTVRLILNRSLRQEQSALLIQALEALGLFGGAGARSRKGFGSLSLESLCLDGEEIWQRPANTDELKQVMRDFLREINPHGVFVSRPLYTAFSSDTKVCIVKTSQNALALLDEIEKELLRYRSYGRLKGSEHVLPWSERAEQNFRDDHDIIQDYLTGREIHRHPRRIVFGLPHNYFFQSLREKAMVEAEHLKRRASPLFIHIHELGEEKYAAVMTLLPAMFLPERERVAIRCPKRQSVYLPCNVGYRVIEEFFERPAFSSRVVVWP